MSFRMKTRTALKDLLEQQGEGAVRVIRETLSEGELAPEDFSLKETWLACTEYESRKRRGTFLRDVTEAVTSDMFPKITGELINAKVIEGYNVEGLVGDQLATTLPSNAKKETIAGVDAVESPEEIAEGGEYNESDMGEIYVTSENKKYGRILSITEEMIYFDKTGEVLRRAQKIGQKARLYREKLILRAVQDLDGTAYRPSDVATAVYSSDNGNLATSNLLGDTGLQTVNKLLHEQTDSEGDPIVLSPNNAICLVPVDLAVTATELARSSRVPEGTENAINYWRGKFEVLTSPYVTAESDTTWYYGSFKDAFAWLEVWPLQTFGQKPNSDNMFRRDLKAVLKVRFYGSCACLDPKYVVKSTA